MRILFMGTPDFAAASLQALLDSPHEIAAVVTQPDKPVGRRQTLTPPPVKRLAEAHGIPVLQPPTLKDPEVQRQLCSFAPDLIAVVAYGKLLPPEVLAIPPLGCVNVHGSLLPKYRGAAPIQRSVLAGEKETGVTTMFMAEGLDTGDILLQARTPIGADETASELFERLAPMGGKLLLETIQAIAEGTAVPVPQQDAQATYAPMLSKKESALTFTQPADRLHRTICGLSAWPCASCVIAGQPVKIYHSALAPGFSGRPGQLLDSKRLIVGCGSGAVELVEVQPQGKKRMAGRDFLNGKRLQKGAVIVENCE